MLKFGTSGLRGLVTELTDKECYLYTIAFLEYLSAQKLIKKNSTVAIAGDFRPSTKKILAASIEAIKDYGCMADYCGIIPTPTVSLYGFTRNIPSIMVTGSHIPYNRNGIKFNLPQGEILKNDEKIISEIYQKLTNEKKFELKFNKIGKLKKSSKLPKVNPIAEKEYIERYIKIFPKKYFKGETVVIYQHSSVIRDIMAEIIKKLGAKVISIGKSKKFIPIDTEAMREIDLENARKWAKKYKSHAIISADGDGDRPILFDEKGEFIRGDLLGVICSTYLKADSVSTTTSGNTALEKSKKFKQTNRTRIGSPYVIEAMYNDQKNGYKKIVAYEANGGYLTCGDLKLNGQKLKALPTRDSILPILCVLALAKQKNRSLSKLLDLFPKRFVYSHSIKGLPTETSLRLIQQISEKGSASKKLAKKLFGLPAEVQRFNFLDGARMFLKNGEIVHVRPSGNAPELRVYCEASTLIRAQQLTEYILKKLENLKK